MGNRYSLKVLYRIFLTGFVLTVLGSWIAAAVRFETVTAFLHLDGNPELIYDITLVGVAIAGLGLLAALFSLPQLGARIARIARLDEHKW